MEHKIIKAADIEKLISFITKNTNSLEDANDRKAFAEITKSLKAAQEMVGDDNKRATCLYDAATKYANQIAFRLFVEDNLAESTLAEFREFETVKTVVGYAEAYTEEDHARADAITKAQQDYMNERKPFEIFQAVINGMTKEEAEQKQAEYTARQQEALENAKTQI